MKRLHLGGLAVLLALAAGTTQAREAGGFQIAQVMTTPAGCHWIDAGGGAQDLWCRDEDGRAHRTQTRRHDSGGYAGATCPQGQLDNGLRCVSETAFMRAAAMEPGYDPMVNALPPFDWRNKTSDGRWRDPSRPDILIVGGGHRWRRAYHITPDY